MLVPMSRATSGRRPMMTNSPVPMAKPPTPRASIARTKPGAAEGVGKGADMKGQVEI
jgi:hypothetical protein